MAIKEKDFINYLCEAHSFGLITFGYEKDKYIVTYGLNRTEGFTGAGETLGKALQSLFDLMMLEVTEDGVYDIPV